MRSLDNGLLSSLFDFRLGVLDIPHLFASANRPKPSSTQLIDLVTLIYSASLLPLYCGYTGESQGLPEELNGI